MSAIIIAVMSAHDIIDEKNLLKILSQNYEVLMSLYPDSELSLSEVSKLTKINEGTLSRSTPILEGSGLIESRSEGVKRGKPKKIIKLTSLSLRLVTLMREALSSRQYEGEPVDLVLIDEYVKLLSSNNIDTREHATNRIEEKSRIYKFPIDSPFHTFLKGNIFNAEFGDVVGPLLRSLSNMIRNSDPKERWEIDRMYREDLLKLSAKAVESDIQARNRFTAVEALSELLPFEDTYSFLKKTYLKSVEENSSYTDSVLLLLSSRYQGREVDLERALIQLLDRPDKDLRDRVGKELSRFH